MNMVADFLWMSDGDFLHYWIAVSLTLIVLDFFINTEFLSWIAMLIFAMWATAWCNPPGVWSVLLFLLFLSVAMAFYILVIKKLTSLIAKVATKDAPTEANDMLAGQHGEVCGSGENLSIKVDGVIYPIATTCHPMVKSGDYAEVAEFRDGMVYIKK